MPPRVAKRKAAAALLCILRVELAQVVINALVDVFDHRSRSALKWRRLPLLALNLLCVDGHEPAPKSPSLRYAG
ncbi:hypothetical protein [Prosthecobacter sp.]|uniref:hypothetical protein n=1 Tax=Prosthecobacter sp. TaxID=1965333 RepID=UPI00378344F6